MRFVGLQVGAEARQIAVWRAMDKAHVFRRCARLVELGLLRRERVVHGQPGLYLATRAGLEFAGLRLPPARVNLWSYAHAVELVWLWIDLEREFGAERIVTERELRTLEGRAVQKARRSGVRHWPHYALEGSAGPRSLHFPDLVVEAAAADGGLLFVELELSVKAAERRREIVWAYLGRSQDVQVRYYAAGDAYRAMRRTLEREGAAEYVELREWWPTTALGFAR